MHTRMVVLSLSMLVCPTPLLQLSADLRDMCSLILSSLEQSERCREMRVYCRLPSSLGTSEARLTCVASRRCSEAAAAGALTD